jgi:hypothetical protein
MIVLMAIEQLFIIAYFTEDRDPGFLYVFREGFLSAQAVQHFRSLAVSGRQVHAFYQLDETQKNKAGAIFRKMRTEHDTLYAFNDDLQKVYLLELLHFITKLQAAAGEVKRSAN